MVYLSPTQIFKIGTPSALLASMRGASIMLTFFLLAGVTRGCFSVLRTYLRASSNSIRGFLSALPYLVLNNFLYMVVTWMPRISGCKRYCSVSSMSKRVLAITGEAVSLTVKGYTIYAGAVQPRYAPMWWQPHATMGAAQCATVTGFRGVIPKGIF